MPLLQGLPYLKLVALWNVCPPVFAIQHAGTHKFCFAVACLLVCLFICLFGVKRHGHRPEIQNNAILLATSYQTSLNVCLEYQYINRPVNPLLSAVPLRSSYYLVQHEDFGKSELQSTYYNVTLIRNVQKYSLHTTPGHS